MTELGRRLSILSPNDRRLTQPGKNGWPVIKLAAKLDVSWTSKLLISRIYEAQTLDLWLKFVRLGETNLSQTGLFCFAAAELLVARRERVRGRSVANWQ
jgi:hypothetical protein